MIWLPIDLSLSVLLILLLKVTFSENLESATYYDYTKTSSLVSSILSSNFQNCTEFFFWGNARISNSPEWTLRNSRNDKFVWSIVEPSHNVSTVFSVLSTIKDLRHRRVECAVAIAFMDKMMNLPAYETANQLVKSIVNVVQSDRDYFVFILNSEEEGDKFLLHPHISQGLRNKLLLVRSGDHILSKTSCPFCGNGKPKILRMNTLSRLAKQDIFPDFFTNFHGKVMRMSSASETKWLNEIRKTGKYKWKAVRGIYVMVTLELTKRLNFTCEFFPSVGGGGTGFRFSNGTWIGTVADVLYGNSELGQVGGQTLSRYQTVDFTFPITYEWLTFTTGQPSSFFTWKAIFRPLSFKSWALVGVSCAVIIISFIGIYWFSDFMERGSALTSDSNVLKENGNNFSVFSKFIGISVEFSLKALIEQGSESLFSQRTKIALVSSWFRALCLFWLLFCVIVTTAYKSKLVSFLAFPNVNQPPTAFEELANSDYSIILQYTGAAYQLFKTSKSPTYMKIVKKMKIEPSDVACLKTVLHSRAACISWENIVDYVAQKNLSDKHGHVPLSKAAAKSYFLLGGIMMRKRTVFKREFDLYIKSAMDSGLMNKWKSLDKQYILEERKEWERNANQTRIDYTPPIQESLTIQHLIGSFYLLLVGVATSTLAFSVELSYRRLVSTRKMRRPSVANLPELTMTIFDEYGFFQNTHI